MYRRVAVVVVVTVKGDAGNVEVWHNLEDDVLVAVAER